MNIFFKNKAGYIVLLLCLWGCKQPFAPPPIIAKNHYLVVEGMINTSGPTTFTLTRTRNATDTGYLNISGVPDSLFETGATVYVEDKQGHASPLPELGKGKYGGTQLYLDAQKMYRLHIKTGEGEEYESAFVPLINTPPIDSISWHVNQDGLHIDVNTHGSSADTRYFKWNYTETWEFHTWFKSTYEYRQDDSSLRPRPEEDQVYQCWQSDSSSDILVGTSDKLKATVLKEVPIALLPYHDEKASVLYSILVKQEGISEAEYEFWLNMKKNTEDLGSIFDPQPSNAKGNIRCISNPQEPVIGYVGAGNVVEKRIFITNSRLPDDWNPAWSSCVLVPVSKDSLWYWYGHHIYYPVNEEDGTFRPCADCTTRGTKVKPSFWP